MAVHLGEQVRASHSVLLELVPLLNAANLLLVLFSIDSILFYLSDLLQSLNLDDLVAGRIELNESLELLLLLRHIPYLFNPFGLCLRN